MTCPGKSDCGQRWTFVPLQPGQQNMPEASSMGGGDQSGLLVLGSTVGSWGQPRQGTGTLKQSPEWHPVCPKAQDSRQQWAGWTAHAGPAPGGACQLRLVVILSLISDLKPLLPGAPPSLFKTGICHPISRLHYFLLRSCSSRLTAGECLPAHPPASLPVHGLVHLWVPAWPDQSEGQGP